MKTKISKATSKGQITLPHEWRKKFNTNNFAIEIYDDKLVVKPVATEEVGSEEVVFDADRDNGGKPFPIEDAIEILKKVIDESN